MKKDCKSSDKNSGVITMAETISIKDLSFLNNRFTINDELAAYISVRKPQEQAAFELDNGEISSCIAAGDGFYFIKCINKFNEELTDANKSKIVEAREKAAFDDVYEEFAQGLSSRLNEKVWDSITLVTDGSIVTDSFFAVWEDALD